MDSPKVLDFTAVGAILTDEGLVGHAGLLVVRRAAGGLDLLHRLVALSLLKLHHVSVPLVEGHAQVSAVAVNHTKEIFFQKKLNRSRTKLMKSFSTIEYWATIFERLPRVLVALDNN